MPEEFVAYALTWYCVFAPSPVIELVNGPAPVPSVVQLSLVVGFAEIAQHTPRAVTVVLPSEATLPPPVAVVAVVAVMEFVVTAMGGTPSILTANLRVSFHQLNYYRLKAVGFGVGCKPTKVPRRCGSPHQEVLCLAARCSS